MPKSMIMTIDAGSRICGHWWLAWPVATHVDAKYRERNVSKEKGVSELLLYPVFIKR